MLLHIFENNKNLYYYLIIINIIGFLSFFVDKIKAILDRWRIPEKTLFLIAILGGSAGCLVGMYICKHKTKKVYFKIGITFIFLIQFYILMKYVNK